MDIAKCKWRITGSVICLFSVVQAGLMLSTRYTNRSHIIHFSGLEWIVKDSQSTAVGPGPNQFAAENIWVEDGYLHLRIDQRNGRWRSSEVISATSFGYGSYSFEIASDIGDLDPNAVLGLFTWSDATAYHHREIDIEISRWRITSNPNCQCVVQPYGEPGHIAHFDIPTDSPGAVFQFDWTPEEVQCTADYTLNHNITKPGLFVFSHRFTTNIPVANGENARINLWLADGKPPAWGREVEVVVKSFRFAPKRGR